MHGECALKPLAVGRELCDRLRRMNNAAITDAEREAVERAADWLERWQRTHGYHSSESGDLATLRGLLERTAVTEPLLKEKRA